MSKVICSIRDAKADYWLDPQVFNSTGTAIRAFEDIVNGRHGDNDVCAHFEDFTLYRIGYFHEESGAVEECELMLLEKGVNLKKIGEEHK